jgi:hypothetical protein
MAGLPFLFQLSAEQIRISEPGKAWSWGIMPLLFLLTNVAGAGCLMFLGIRGWYFVKEDRPIIKLDNEGFIVRPK